MISQKTCGQVFHSNEQMCVKKKLLKFHFHLKDDKNCVRILYIKNPLYMFIKTLDEIKRKLPQYIPKYTLKIVHFLA
jgi:hypothetical protein